MWGNCILARKSLSITEFLLTQYGFGFGTKKISAIKVGREYRISEDAIKEFEEKNKTTAEE